MPSEVEISVKTKMRIDLSVEVLIMRERIRALAVFENAHLIPNEELSELILIALYTVKKIKVRSDDCELYFCTTNVRRRTGGLRSLLQVMIVSRVRGIINGSKSHFRLCDFVGLSKDSTLYL